MQRLLSVLCCAAALLSAAMVRSDGNDKPKKDPAANGSQPKTIKKRPPTDTNPAAEVPKKKKPASNDKTPATEGMKNKPVSDAPKDSSAAARPTSRPALRRTTAPAIGSSTLVTKKIDEQLDAQLKSAGLVAAPVADDAEFLRRAYLDLHGVVPAADEVREFLADSAVDKRPKLVDRLLADRRFAVHMADQWDDFLMPGTDDLQVEKKRLTEWLEESFQNQSWNQIAYELLTASGKREENPEVVYLLKGRETLTPPEVTDLVSQYFMGVRLNCAQCHDHPFTSLKQSEYWGMAAFFTEIQYTDRRQQKSGIIRDDTAITLTKLENAEKLRTPKFLGSDAFQPSSGVPRRAALAEWITSPDNPYFARAMVNRTWGGLFGRGLVEPVDDMHRDNPATHPELLATLSERFVASGFDLRDLCRAICNSAAYQRTSMPLPGRELETASYERMTVKVLTPEQLYDSLAIVLPASGPPKGSRAADPREEFVRFFRSEGEPNPMAYTRGIPQTLRMMNSPQLLSPSNEAALVRRIVESDSAAAADTIERLYLHVLARKPTDDERKTLDDFLAEHPGERDEAYAEILWALINSSEFSLNH
jgi:hypothetical protein